MDKLNPILNDRRAYESEEQRKERSRKCMEKKQEAAKRAREEAEKNKTQEERKQEEDEKQRKLEEQKQRKQESAKERRERAKEEGEFTCALCNYSGGSRSQLDAHYNSKKHKRNELRQTDPEKAEKEERAKEEKARTSKTAAQRKRTEKNKDTGKYLCDTCSYNAGSAYLLKRHLETEKHNRNMRLKAQTENEKTVKRRIVIATKTTTETTKTIEEF